MNVYKLALENLTRYVKPPRHAIRRRGHKTFPPTPHLMKLGRAYAGPGWALCKFMGRDLHYEDEQRAFNEVAACVPERIRMLPRHRGGPEWIFLPSGATDKSDPLGQCGYWGAKWEVATKEAR